MTIRRATPADAPALAALSAASIRELTAEHYTAAAREAWARRRTDVAHQRMIETTLTLVAVVDDDEPAGFASLALEPVGALERGEVDQLFVAPALGGRGVARALLDAVAQAAAEAGIDELVTHASWRAAPVFERHGFVQVEVETVTLDGEELTRARMRRRLTGA